MILFTVNDDIYNQSYDVLISTKSKKENGLKIDFNLEVPENYDFVEILLCIHNKS